MQPNPTTWRHARAKLDLSVEDAARKLEIAPGSLRNIESGQPRAVVSLRLAYRAADLYGVPFDTLVDTTTEDPPPRKEPKAEPVAPPKRQDPNRAPKRVASRAVA